MRLATGCPALVRCARLRDVLKPIAPAATASRTTCRIRCFSSSVAVSLNARSPIAAARTAECPHWAPMFSAFGSASTASM